MGDLGIELLAPVIIQGKHENKSSCLKPQGLARALIFI